MENFPDPLFDLAELEALAPDDPGFRKEMVSLFISQNETTRAEIAEGLKNKDLKKVKALLHKIKSTLRVMGVDSVIALIMKAEMLELPGKDEDELVSLCHEIDQLLARVDHQLTDYLAEHF